MMRVRVCLAVAAAMFLGASERAPDADTAVRLDIIGMWAVDCGMPPSRTNPWEIYEANFEGGVERILRMSGSRDEGQTMVGAIKDEGNGFWSSIWMRESDSAVTMMVMQRRGDRQRTWSSKTMNNQYLIRDGVIVATGQPTIWFENCGD